MGHLVKSELLQHIVKLATTDQSQQIQDRSFDILVKMTEPEYQELMVQQGILDELLSIVAVPTDVTDDQESQAFLDEATSTQNPTGKLFDELDIVEVELEVESPTTRSNLKWACTACTFLNEAELSVCAICDGPKPTDSDLLLINDAPVISFPSDDHSDAPNRPTTEENNTQQSNADNIPSRTEPEFMNAMNSITQEITDLEKIYNEATQKQEDDPPVEWACPACTFFNNAASIFCEICETPKPQPQKNSPSSPPQIIQDPIQINSSIPDVLPNVHNTDSATENLLNDQRTLNANPYTTQQQQRALEVLRRFDGM